MSAIARPFLSGTFTPAGKYFEIGWSRETCCIAVQWAGIALNQRSVRDDSPSFRRNKADPDPDALMENVEPFGLESCEYRHRKPETLWMAAGQLLAGR
jgi:hypothetical protein